MRLRDNKMYLLISALVFIIVAIFNIFYLSSCEQKVFDIASDNALVDCKNDLVGLEDEILSIKYDFYTNASNCKAKLVESPVSDAQTYFENEKNTCIAKASTIENNSNDDTFYLYILDETTNRLGRCDFDSFDSISASKRNRIFDLTAGEIVYGKNSDGTSVFEPFYSYLASNGCEDVSAVKSKTETRTNFTFELKGKYFVSLVYMGKTFYYAQIVENDTYLSGLNSLDTLSLGFTIVVLLAIISILIVGIMMIRKHDKMISYSKKAASRNDSIIIRAKKDGKIIEVYHKIKQLSKRPDLLKNIFDFITTDGKLVKEYIKTPERFICKYDIDGTAIYIEFAVFHYGMTYHLVGFDVTKNYTVMRILEDLTSKNSITSLPNYYQMISDFSEVKKDSFNKTLRFVMVKITEYDDLDKLFGIDIAHQIMVESSKRILSTIGNNKLYHIDDNTFVVVLSSSLKEENTRIFEGILKVLNQTYVVKINTLSIKAKLAMYEVANAESSNLDFDDVMRKLNVAMERALITINRQWIKYDATIQNYVNYRAQMQEDIVKAIDNNEFVMYYQPQYSVEENRVIGFEALIRWNNPKYIGISPQEYIELAEKNGSIIDIGNFIIKDVFKTAKKFEPYGVHISINVSPAQLFQEGFTGFLLDEFEKNDLKKGSIAVEITETFLMENFSVILEKLAILKNRGFSIHLDDFGTGYSSMLYLKELPIDTIKTDRDFIRNIANDNNTRLIIKGIISLAKSLNLKVISEGVETIEQAEILKKIGSDYLQGYLLSKAVPFESALEMVKNGINLYSKAHKKGRE